MNDGIDVAFGRGSFTIRKADGQRVPIEHRSMHQAERAAARLIEANPDATFIISQEVARVTRWPEKEKLNV